MPLGPQVLAGRGCHRDHRGHGCSQGRGSCARLREKRKDGAETWKGIWLFCLRTEKRDEGNVESFPFGRKSYMTNRNFYGFCHRPKLSPQDSIELFSFPRTFSKIAIIHSSFVDRLCLLGNRTTFLLQGGCRVKNRGHSGCPVTSELQE